jgi:chorismate-pyruvate lyase
MPRHLALAAALAAGVSLSAQAPIEKFAEIQALSAQLLSSRSATATLESWCRDHRLADDPRVVAYLVAGASKTPSGEQLRHLDVASGREVKYRHVRLACGTHVLSDADNWYVPARLTAEMNRLLETTDTPFGRAVAPLEPFRKTLSVRILWSDTTTPIPDVVFEHRAVLYTRDKTPFSEVVERYRRDLVP